MPPSSNDRPTFTEGDELPRLPGLQIPQASAGPEALRGPDLYTGLSRVEAGAPDPEATHLATTVSAVITNVTTTRRCVGIPWL